MNDGQSPLGGQPMNLNTQNFGVQQDMSFQPVGGDIVMQGEKKSKKWVFVVLAVIVVLAIVGLSIFAMTNRGKSGGGGASNRIDAYRNAVINGFDNDRNITDIVYSYKIHYALNDAITDSRFDDSIESSKTYIGKVDDLLESINNDDSSEDEISFYNYHREYLTIVKVFIDYQYKNSDEIMNDVLKDGFVAIEDKNAIIANSINSINNEESQQYLDLLKKEQDVVEEYLKNTSGNECKSLEECENDYIDATLGELSSIIEKIEKNVKSSSKSVISSCVGYNTESRNEKNNE